MSVKLSLRLSGCSAQLLFGFDTKVVGHVQLELQRVFPIMSNARMLPAVPSLVAVLESVQRLN